MDSPARMKMGLRRAMALGSVFAVIALLAAGCRESPTYPPPSSSQATSDDRGAWRFQIYCAPCHQQDGSGMPGRIPPLAQSPWVSGSEERMIRVVLQGLRGPIEVDGATYEAEMLAFGPILADDEIASIVGYIRKRFGGAGTTITPQQVERVRAATAGRTEYWTAEELRKVP